MTYFSLTRSVVRRLRYSWLDHDNNGLPDRLVLSWVSTTNPQEGDEGRELFWVPVTGDPKDADNQMNAAISAVAKYLSIFRQEMTPTGMALKTDYPPDAYSFAYHLTGPGLHFCRVQDATTQALSLPHLKHTYFACLEIFEAVGNRLNLRNVKRACQASFISTGNVNAVSAAIKKIRQDHVTHNCPPQEYIRGLAIYRDIMGFRDREFKKIRPNSWTYDKISLMV
jgi:hypothetical protein